MKARRLIRCLCLTTLCSTALLAQQVLTTVASASAAGEAPDFTAFPAPEAQPVSPSIRVASVSPNFEAIQLSAGLPIETSLYEAIQPSASPNVCMQAYRPIMFNESDYVFGRLTLSAAAIKGTFRHENLVKMGRNFVPGQPLPDAPSYVPLTSRQKFDAFVHNTHTIGFAAGILIDSFISQASGAYPSFGGGMEGYGKRLGAAAAGETSAAFFSGYVFPTLLHQDPRYFRSRQDAISQRLAYAASRVLIGRSDDGRNVINTSAILGQFVQAAVSNAYIPYRNESVSGTLENAVSGLGAVAQAQILNEFWPDIKEFFSRHNPETLLRHGDPPSYPDEIASK